MYDVIIVGGGAAGLWAAGTAAARSRRVLVLEKNRKAGVKILMSGGTRCNITHGCDIDGIILAFGAQGRFLKPALHRLAPEQVLQEINRLGVATKLEETGKVFPVSDRAIDVRDALVRRLTEHAAELRTGVAVQDVRKLETGQWRVQADGEEIIASKVILATGGLSYPGCGTTGDGYAWAKLAGHTVEPTHPALAPLLSPALWVHGLQGLTLEDARVSVIEQNGKRLRDPRHTSRGGFLWTHFGCSGPAAMNVSGCISAMQQPHQALLEIDLLPDLDAAACTSLLSAQVSGGRKSVLSIMQQQVPRRLAESLLQMASVSNDTSLAELTKQGRLQLLESLKGLRVPLAGTRGFGKAEVTAGGVRRQEVDPHTMQSRLVEGLYLIGEILDVDGPIGGYNFQAAFSTGHAAGLHV